MNIKRLLLVFPLFSIFLAQSISFADNGCLWDGGTRLQLPSDKPVLFVTHGTQGYDHSLSAKTGIDRTISVFERMGWPTIYLNDCGGAEGFKPYMADTSPTADICSVGGEHEVTPKNPNIFLSGGYYNGCAGSTFYQAVRYAIEEQLKEKPWKRPLVVVHYILDGLYTRPNTIPGQLDIFYNYPYRQEHRRPRRGIVNQNLLESLIGSGFNLNNPTVLSNNAISFLAQGFPAIYKTVLYHENRFIKILGEDRGENPPFLVIRLTTSASIASNPLAYLNFYNNPVKTRGVAPEKKALDAPSFSPGSATDIFDHSRPPVKVLSVMP